MRARVIGPGSGRWARGGGGAALAAGLVVLLARASASADVSDGGGAGASWAMDGGEADASAAGDADGGASLDGASAPSGDARAAPGVDGSAPGTTAANNVAANTASNTPSGPAAGNEPTAPRVRRRRRRRRRTGIPRNRGPIVTLGYRYSSIPTEGAPGPAHAVYFQVLPLARLRRPGTYVRLAIGAEGVFRLAQHDTTDLIFALTAGAGGQYPTRYVTPYGMLVFHGGLALRSRFLRTIAEFAQTFGVEAGADVRFGGPFGLGVALGVGRTMIGAQWSYSGWVRVGISLF